MSTTLELQSPLGDQLQPLMALMILQLPLGQGREGRDLNGDSMTCTWQGVDEGEH